MALGYADQIFALSTEMEAAIGAAASGEHVLEFRVGIADAVPKSIAYRLLEPALGLPETVRLICTEGKFQDLLAQISVHRLDLVIADEPMSKQLSVKAFNHALGTTEMSFFASPGLNDAEGHLPAEPAGRAHADPGRRRRPCASGSSCG